MLVYCSVCGEEMIAIAELPEDEEYICEECFFFIGEDFAVRLEKEDTNNDG